MIRIKHGERAWKSERVREQTADESVVGVEIDWMRGGMTKGMTHMVEQRGDNLIIEYLSIEMCVSANMRTMHYYHSKLVNKIKHSV